MKTSMTKHPGDALARPVDRETLEQQADLVRSRLLHTIDSLDRRRHNLLDWRLQVRKYARGLAMAGGALAFALVGTAGYVVYRVVTRESRLRKARIAMLVRVWKHPELAARKKESAGGRLGKMIFSMIASAALEIGKRALEHLLEPQPLQEVRGLLPPVQPSVDTVNVFPAPARGRSDR